MVRISLGALLSIRPLPVFIGGGVSICVGVVLAPVCGGRCWYVTVTEKTSSPLALSITAVDADTYSQLSLRTVLYTYDLGLLSGVFGAGNFLAKERRVASSVGVLLA